MWSFDAKTDFVSSRGTPRRRIRRRRTCALEIGDLPSLPIRTDEEKLAKIIDILVLNGLKFTEAGSVRVDATMQPDGPLEIRVRDTGIGMRPDEVEEVLEGFRQADPTARKRFRGIGLGLRLLTRMVAAIGGTSRRHEHPRGWNRIRRHDSSDRGEHDGRRIDLPSQTAPEMKVQLSA